MKNKMAGQTFALLASLTGNAAQAQNLENGQHIAQTWCRNCHQVDEKARKGNDAVPSFPSIAQTSGMTTTAISVFLSTSHSRMPDFSLSRAEIHDVAAYVMSLKDSHPEKSPKTP